MRIHRHLQRKLTTTKPRCSRRLFRRGSGLLLYLSLALLSAPLYQSSAETVYVVERERSSLAVIKDGKWLGEISNLGDTSHTTVKFSKGFAFAISRDGYLSKIDPKTQQLVKKVKVGNSGIGLIFIKEYIAVANYDPGTVVILDLNLNLVNTIKTGSRNVGIKALDNKLIFSLMDKNEIWVIDADKDFSLQKKFTDVGELPFDALLSGNRYIVGFFNDTRLGSVNLETMEFKPMELDQGAQETVLKIPHFGQWGVAGGSVFIPANKAKKLHIVSLADFKYQGTIDLIGTPVFVAASPDKKTLAINYSGEKENFLTIVDPLTKKVIKNIKAGKRIMHFRFSTTGEELYLSSYFDNQVKIFKVSSWQQSSYVDVATPSGIFILK